MGRKKTKSAPSQKKNAPSPAKNSPPQNAVSSFFSPHSDFSIHAASNSEIPAWRSLAETLFQNSSIELGADDILLLAFAGASEPIGFVHLRPHQSFVLLAGIGVIPAWQGRGVGRALMETAMQESQKKWPNLPFQLEVEQANPAALRLYASWGFALTKMGTGTYQLRRAALN